MPRLSCPVETELSTHCLVTFPLQKYPTAQIGTFHQSTRDTGLVIPDLNRKTWVFRTKFEEHEAYTSQAPLVTILALSFVQTEALSFNLEPLDGWLGRAWLGLEFGQGVVSSGRAHH